MAISTEGKIALALALALPIATAVSVVAPDTAKPIAWVVIALCSLGLFGLGAHHFGDLFHRRLKRGGQSKMWSFVGMVICLVGATGSGIWHFWPATLPVPLPTPAPRPHAQERLAARAERLRILLDCSQSMVPVRRDDSDALTSFRSTTLRQPGTTRSARVLRVAWPGLASGAALEEGQTI